MNPASDFSVAFGKTARTLIYNDSLGTVCFCFDIAPAEHQIKAKWTLYLERQPFSEDGKTLEFVTITERERIAVALERTKKYTESRGYQVEMV